MKKQNLLTYLKGLTPDTMVYLGTKDGSGWLYIETAEDVLMNLDELDSKYRGDVEKKCNTAQEKLNTLPGVIVKTQEKIEVCTDEDELVALKRSLAGNEAKYVAAFDTRQKWRPYLNLWKELKKREVVDTYDHTTDIRGICVIVEGMDVGKLWFYNEFKVI